MSKRRRASSGTAAAASAPAAAAAAAAADAAAAAADAAADAATFAPRNTKRPAQRARSVRRRGAGVLPGRAAAQRRKAAELQRDALRQQAMQLLADAATVSATLAQAQAGVAAHHARVAAFMSQTGARRQMEAAAAVPLADADGDAPGSGASSASDSDSPSDVEDADESAGPREVKSALAADRKERAAALRTRKRGSKLTAAEISAVLLQLHERRRLGDGREASIRYVAQVMGMGRDTLRRLWKEHDPHNEGDALPYSAEAPAPPSGAGGRPQKQLRTAQVQCVRRYVLSAHKADRTVRYTELYAAVKSDLPLLELPSLSVFRRRLKSDHQIRFLRSGAVVPRTGHVNSAALRAEFVQRLSAAYEEERAGRGVVVWFDESFCHTHHRREGSVVDMTDQKQFVVRRRAAPAAAVRTGGGGTLFIVFHAVTRDGLVVTRNTDGAAITVSEENNHSAPTAEWVYRSSRVTDDSDYHKHVTSDAVVQWMERRLLPALRALYPNKKYYLIGDNARTHKAMPPEHISHSSGSKKAIGAYLWERGIRTMAVRDGNGKVLKRFDHTTWAMPSPKGPSVRQMREYLRRYYAERPETALTRVQELLAVEVLHRTAQSCCCVLIRRVHRVQSKRDGFDWDKGHCLLHTPPYEHESTPIERVWAVAKGHAARVHVGTRTPDQLRVELLEGFYGSDRCSGVTTEHVTNFIRSADACITGWIRSIDLLRAAYPHGTATEAMTIASYGEAERRRYRTQNTLIVTFDDGTDSSESSDSSSDGGGTQAAAPAAAAAAAPASAAAR
jgi:hypothetical protein